MNAETALQELETLAEKLQVDVSYDQFTGEGNSGGGLCRIKGRWRVIIERRACASEKVSLLARCLAQFDMDSHFVSPAVRQLIEQHRSSEQT